MIFINPISSIFDYSTYALMLFVFGANSREHQALFQTGWFVEGLMTQTLVVHVIRTAKVPFFQSRASVLMLAITATVMGVGIYLPFPPLAIRLHTKVTIKLKKLWRSPQLFEFYNCRYLY
jgi:Mg2+-importing ATPase